MLPHPVVQNPLILFGPGADDILRDDIRAAMRKGFISLPINGGFKRVELAHDPRHRISARAAQKSACFCQDGGDMRFHPLRRFCRHSFATLFATTAMNTLTH